MNKEGVLIDPGYLEWAGVAAFKNAYKIFKERGYKTRLLAAAYRNHMQWSEFIGGDVSMTIPHKWIKRFANSDIEVVDRMQNPVDPKIISELKNKFPEFVRGYEPDGMKPSEFDSYGATARTLLGFIKGYEEMLGMIRNFMIPNPDK
jgi:transaldolase